MPPERLLASLQTYANSAPFQGPASHGWARDELGRFIPVQLGGQTATQGMQPTNVAYGCLWANRLLFSGDEHRDLDANWDLKRLA